MTTITATGHLSPESMATLAAWFESGAEHDKAEIARARDLSRLSGMEVVMDLSMFDLEWSPIYWHDRPDPMAWVNAAGDRQPGPDYPKDPTP